MHNILHIYISILCLNYIQSISSMIEAFFWAAKRCRSNQMRLSLEIMNMTYSVWSSQIMMLIIIWPVGDVWWSLISSLGVCWDHNPELSHHDQARQAQPFSGAAYNGKWLRFSFSQCFLNQSRCHTQERRLEEGLEGSWTWRLIGQCVGLPSSDCSILITWPENWPAIGRS